MVPTLRDGYLRTQIAVEGTLDRSPDALFVHATGFCKELWRPVVRVVADGDPLFGYLAMDVRGHGDSDTSDVGYSWDLLARDVLAVLEGVATPPVGVGHSSGAAALARAEILAPDTFSALVLIEPILFPPPYVGYSGPLVEGSLRRRRHFATRQDAIDRFGSRGFRDWTDEVLGLYVDHGFAASGDGLDLKCLPEVEAEVFIESGNVDTWDRLGEIDIPVTVVTAEHSDSHQDPHLSLLIDQFNDAAHIPIPGASHLAPMEVPDVVGRVVRSVVDAWI
jgi:pimeloyl-ACP methyl ester carboxylesterase